MKLFARAVIGIAAALAALAGPAVAADIAISSPTPTYREFILGKPSAKVTVIEYGSVTCPHCARFYVNAFPQLKKDYIDTGKIKFIFRDIPTPPANLSLAAGGVARCAPGDRGMALIETLFKNQQEWMAKPNESIRAYAQLAGMSSADVDACLKNEALFKEMQAVVERANTLYHISGTPTFIVGDAQVESELYEPLKQAVDKALAKAH